MPSQPVPTPAAPASASPSFVDRLLALLPQGAGLTEQEWRPRHLAIVAVLAAHALALPAFAIVMGYDPAHGIAEGGLLIGAFAALAALPALPRRVRTVIASTGLITCSALLVHFSGGYIEAHFHFFVILAVIALYQDWAPFGIAVGYVAIHHGAFGLLMPGSVYNHPDAIAHPFQWALIHASFVLAESAAILAFWRFNEDARAQTELVLHSAGDGIVGVDGSGVVTFANPAAAALTGREPGSLPGLRLDALVAARGAVPVGAQASGIDLPLARPNGSHVLADWSTNPVRSGHEDLGVVLTLKDATLRRRGLELVSREKELAEASSRAKAEFLANMSHEIRTPMNAVIGMTSLLQTTPLTIEQRDYVETIRNAGANLLVVINDILDFSKIEAGKLELENQPFHLRSCVEEAMDLLAPRAAEKGLELACVIDDAVPHGLRGDVGRVRQVLVNLLGNGIKFTDRGEVVVRVTSKPLDDGVHEVRFAVRDTGIGIPPERMDRLFKSFSQVDSSVTRTHGGTGLGLAISKRLTEMMGGQISAESEPGKGSTFAFTILVEAAEPPASNRDRAPAAFLHGARVLVVDDNATNRRVLTAHTKSWGMEPVEAASGADALELLKAGHAFDLAILDYQMPMLDGATLAQHIHALPGCQSLPLVLLSSMGHHNESIKAARSHFAALLTKPVKQSSLHDTISEVLVPTSATAPQPMVQIVASQTPLRILLVEDNAVNQKVASRMLQKLGYNADIAGNGLEAIEAVGRQRYDLVFMDVQMPEMDGLEATRAICARWAKHERPRIVAMTAHALVGDKERCLEAGMDDYITKPVDGQQLARAVERARAAIGAPSAPGSNGERAA